MEPKRGLLKQIIRQSDSINQLRKKGPPPPQPLPAPGAASASPCPCAGPVPSPDAASPHATSVPSPSSPPRLSRALRPRPAAPPAAGGASSCARGRRPSPCTCGRRPVPLHLLHPTAVGAPRPTASAPLPLLHPPAAGAPPPARRRSPPGSPPGPCAYGRHCSPWATAGAAPHGPWPAPLLVLSRWCPSLVLRLEGAESYRVPPSPTSQLPPHQGRSHPHQVSPANPPPPSYHHRRSLFALNSGHRLWYLAVGRLLLPRS